MTEIVINNVSLDIYKDIPISLNFSIADIRNPEKRNTSFSKTITIPGSKKNNLLFGNIFEVSKESDSEGLVNFSPDFNPSLKASCRVYTDTMLEMDGYCQLLKIIKQDNSYDYEICIFGVLGDFFVNIEGKELSSLDFSEYAHALNQSSFERSWDNSIKKYGVDYVNFVNTYSNNQTGLATDVNKVTLLGTAAPMITAGGVIFINGSAFIVAAKTLIGPNALIEIAFPFVASIGESITISNGSVTSSTPKGEGYLYPTINYGYGTSMYQYDALTMYPSLYLKSYIDKIFKLAGFTYSGTFKALEIFKRLVIPASSNVDRVSDALITQNTVIQSYISDFLILDVYKPQNTATAKILFPNTVQDITDMFNPATGIATIKKAGVYEIIVDWQTQSAGEFLDYPPYAYNLKLPASARVKVSCLGANGSNFFTSFGIENDGANSGQLKIPSITFIQGGTIKLEITGQAHITIKAGTKITIRPIGVPLAIGDIVNLNATVPKGIPLKDFVLSWFKMFNLYVSVNPNNSKDLIIESAKDFYKNNQVLEWSNKLDRSSPVEIFPVSEIEGKNYIFSYKEDGDYYNKLYTETYKEVYGNRDVSVINDFAKGKKEISLIFSPTVSVDTPLNKMVVPHILSKEDNGAFTPFDSNIRILYYGGLKPCNGSFKIKYLSDVTYTKYPYVGHLDDPFSPNLDLLFEIPKVIYWNTSIYTTSNLYNVYYRKFIDEITDKNSKVIKGKFRIKSIDIFKLDFRNFIQIDNINYRLNRILDYNPINQELCTVELAKIKNGIDYTAYQIDLNIKVSGNIIQGGLNEVRSIYATSIVQLIQGGLNEVQSTANGTYGQIINGGTD